MTQLSSFAHGVFADKYQLTPNETWEECAARVAKFLDFDDPRMEARVAQAIASRKFIPGGRYLYGAGREIAQNTNCLAGETEVLTRRGLKPIRDLVGGVTLLTYSGSGRGRWVAAHIQSFGVQPLLRVVMRRGKTHKDIFATYDHDWLMRSLSGGAVHRVKTRHLVDKRFRVVEALAHSYRQRVKPSPIGIQHGIWYGDGSSSPSEAHTNTLRLCGEKNAVLHVHFPTFQIDQPAWAGGDFVVRGAPNFFKARPSIDETHGYLLGWLMGYFAADGCVDEAGAPMLTSTDEASLRFARDVASILGIGTYSLRYQDRVSNLTGRPSRLWVLNLKGATLGKEFFLLPHHAERFRNDTREIGWTVEEVLDSGRNEEVFCAVVPETHNFVLADSIVTGNCFLLRAEDSREGWANLCLKHVMALSTGGGVGTYYGDVRERGRPLKRFGGEASGPISLMSMVNEQARHIQDGAARRAALWAGLPWSHPDVMDFIHAKDWPTFTRAMKERDFNHAAMLDQTNISVCLDDAFFTAMRDGDRRAKEVFEEAVKRMSKTGEPGFSIDVGEYADEVGRNPCVAGEIEILTDQGYARIDSLVGQTVRIWNGERWSDVVPRETGRDQPMVIVELSDGTSLRCTAYHEWVIERGLRNSERTSRHERVEAWHLHEGDRLGRFGMPIIEGEKNDPKWLYTHGFYCADGFDYQGQKRAWIYEPKRAAFDGLEVEAVHSPWGGRFGVRFPSTLPEKGWVPGCEYDVVSRLAWLAGWLDGDGGLAKNPNSACIQAASVDRGFLLRVRKMLTTLGVCAKVVRMRDAGIGPKPDGRGGLKEYPHAAIWRLLLSASDSYALVSLGLPCRRLDVSRCATPQRDARRFVRVLHVKEDGIEPVVYCFDEPLAHRGTFDGVILGQCTEVTSGGADLVRGDCCNLGSVNFSRIDTLDELVRLTELQVQVLLTGTFVGWLPHQDFAETRRRNRRIGAGFMGLHEWLLKRGYRYEPNPELEEWLATWARVVDETSEKLARRFGVPKPIRTRAVAPTGTIGIIAETTTGIEPVFCVAYKRRTQHKGKHKFQYVVDPTAKRLIESGVKPAQIEDAHCLAQDVERRIAMQAFVQRWVDQGISSTINVPEWGEPGNNDWRAFARVLLKYLPNLRGVTVYPEGARPGQPITPVSYEEAIEAGDTVFEEDGDRCSTGVCGA